ncbi:MAG: ferric reductase-like transmembrane domain-containing protein [Candidatus Falkowbacteria bacterium]|nr:ferric reductase-like transmembrane domain-containing protein [Candidatus Falkowbacteria bacterium]
MKNFSKSLILFLSSIIFLAVLVFVLLSLMPADQMISLPWYITRASALTSFVLMFFVVFLGTGMTTSFIYGLINPVRAWVIHKYLSLAMTLMIFLHAGSLLFDKFIKLSLADVLIPFSSSYRPLYLSLGILGFYILLGIILTSIFLRLRMPRFWRSTHYWVYPLFGLGIIHGLFMGTDSSAAIMQFVYWTTGIIFVMLLAYRFLYYRSKIKFN